MSSTDSTTDFEIFTTFRFDPRFAPPDHGQPQALDISMLYMPRHHYARLRSAAEHFGFPTRSNVLRHFDSFSEYVLEAIRRRRQDEEEEKESPAEAVPSALRVRDIVIN